MESVGFLVSIDTVKEVSFSLLMLQLPYNNKGKTFSQFQKFISTSTDIIIFILFVCLMKMEYDLAYVFNLFHWRLLFPDFLSNVLSYRIYYYYFYRRAVHKVFPSHHEHYFILVFLLELWFLVLSKRAIYLFLQQRWKFIDEQVQTPTWGGGESPKRAY